MLQVGGAGRNFLHAKLMSGFDEAEAERGVRATRKHAQGDQQPGPAAEVLQLAMPFIGNEKNAHGSAPPRLGKCRCHQRSNSAALIQAEAAPELDRSVSASQDQAQIGRVSIFCSEPHPERGQFDLLPGAVAITHPAVSKFERFTDRSGLAMPFERESQGCHRKDREGRDQPVAMQGRTDAGYHEQQGDDAETDPRILRQVRAVLLHVQD